MYKKKLTHLMCVILFTNLFFMSKFVIAATEAIPIKQLQNYNHYSSSVKELITEANTLSSKHLTYMFGSADPKNKGMDCSGTFYYLLKNLNIDEVPRQADQIYEWVWKEGDFFAVNSTRLDSFEFKNLKPGDLLFWSGTYKVRRTVPVTHVMLYLGKNKEGKHLMFGASNGRTYQGKSMWGVSAFDFKLPNAKSKSRFLGYSCIPHLTCEA